MARPPLAIKQGDVTRALKAARAAGLKVGSCEIDHSTGKIVIRADTDEKAEGSAYERWKAAGHGPR